jgi:hypothetical protein
MGNRLQKAAGDFATNWCYDVNGGLGKEEVIKSDGKVVSRSEGSGKSIIRIATDVWVFREAEDGGIVANYTETHEIEENELLDDTGPDGFPAYIPSDLIEASCGEFDLLSTDFQSLAQVPTEILDAAAKLLAQSLADSGFEDFFSAECEWEYELPSLHPIVSRVIDKKCREHSLKIKEEIEEENKARATFELQIELETPIFVRSEESVDWTDSLPRNFAIFKTKTGSGAREMRLGIQFKEWLEAQREEGIKVVSAAGTWQGNQTRGLVVVFGISEDEARSRKIAGEMACALYVEAGAVPKML